LKRQLQSSSCKTVIIDIDTVSIDNYAIKDLTTKNPGVYFFCLSKDHFHPELKDVIGRYIYACISKPVDLEELFFWLEAVQHNHNGFDDKSPA
jgi:DNA-binding NtrC family response regulator